MFEGPLRRLLSAPELYLWDIRKLVPHSRSHLMIGMVSKPELMIRAAREFHTMPHRNKDLRELATALFLTSEEVRAYLEGVREYWKVRQTEDRGTSEMLLQMSTRFDFSQYERVDHPKAGPLIVNRQEYER